MFYLHVNNDSHEGGRDERAGVALVLSFCQFHKLLVQFVLFPVISSRVDRIHGRSIEFFEQLDELRRAFLGMSEVIRVRHHGDVLLRYSGMAEALDDVALHTPSHRADEPLRSRRRERRTYSEQLRHERRIVGYPVAHYDLAARFSDPHHFLSDVEWLRCKHCAEHGESQFKRIVADSFQIASVPLMKLQPMEACLLCALIAGLHKVPCYIDSRYSGAQTG